jgi:hypothetical protein
VAAKPVETSFVAENTGCRGQLARDGPPVRRGGGHGLAAAMDDDCSSEIVTEDAPERRHKVSLGPIGHPWFEPRQLAFSPLFFFQLGFFCTMEFINLLDQ